MIDVTPPEEKGERKLPSFGRPSLYSQELADSLCESLANGITLQQWCELVQINVSTVWRWSRDREDFRKALASAREAQAFFWANEIITLADDSTEDWMEVPVGDPEKGRTKTVFNRDHYERVRTRIQTRQWLMTRYDPSKYGDRVQVEDVTPPGKRDLEGLIRIAKERARALGVAEPDFKMILGRQG